MRSAQVPNPDTEFVAHHPEGTRPEERGTWSREIILILAACVAVPLLIAYGFGSHFELQVCAIIIGVAGLAIGLAHPFWGLIFFVALLYVRPEETVPALRGMHFTLIAAIVASLSVVLQKLMDREAPVKFPVNGLIIGFGAIVVLSTFNKSGMETAIQDAGRLVALVLMVCNLVRTPARYRALSNAVVIFTLYLALFSVFRYYTGIAFNRGTVLQAEGTGIFNDPNDLSATIVAGLGLALCRAFATQGARRILFASASGLMVWAIYLTNSRGGMLALVATIAAFVLINSRSRWIALVLVLALGAGAVKFGPSRMKDLNTQEESANSRLRFWHNGTMRFIANPVTGVGYGLFPELNNGFTAHNSFVLCYTELGLPGYFCWMGCLYYAFRGLRRRGEGGPQVTARGRPAPVVARAAAAALQSKPPAPSLEFYDIMGARLALAGFLLAGFWISRTYVPVLYLLIALPLAHQIAYRGAGSDFSLSPKQRWIDAWTILALCVASIAFIALIAWKLRG